MEEPWHRLRWKLCKLWHVPATHEMFDELNMAQWLWYFHNFLKDQDEDFEYKRNFIEYHASFIEPEAVKKIRESREKSVSLSDNEFSDVLRNTFGRGLTGEIKGAHESQIHNVNIGDILNNISNIKYRQRIKHDKTMNYRHWSDINLE